MAKPVKSIWTVTFDLGGANEYVLAEPDLLLEDEIETGWTDAAEDGDYIEADDSEPLGTGHRKRDFKLTVFRKHASPVAAREFGFQTDLAVPGSNVRADLTVAITGGATYVYSNCLFTSGRTSPRRGVGEHQTATTYELKCGKLFLTASAGPDPVGLNDAALNLSGSTGLLDAGGDAAGYLEGLATWTNTGTGDDAAQATSGNRAAVLAGGGIHHPGIAGNWAYVSDAATVDVAATFALRWDGILPDYTPAARMALLAKWKVAGDLRSYALYLDTAGTVTLEVSSTGAAGSVLAYTSTVATGLTGGTPVGISARKNGTSLSFYLHASLTDADGVKLGDSITVTSSTPFATAQPLEIGSTDDGTLAPLHGLTLQVAVWNNSVSTDLGTASLVRNYRDDGADYAAFVFTTGIDPLRVMSSTSARFDGTNDSLALATPVPLNAIAGLTMVAVIWPNRLTGTQDLIFCGTNAANPRALLRLNGTTIELHVRRTDAEATAVISYASGLILTSSAVVSASIDYAAGTAAIYQGGSLKATGALTSAGVTSATDSSETRIMAGQGGANPTAADLYAVHLATEATGPLDHAALVASILGELS